MSEWCINVFCGRVNQGESLASWVNWLLCVGLWSWVTYHFAEKGILDPSRGLQNVTTRLCCAQHGHQTPQLQTVANPGTSDLKIVLSHKASRSHQMETFLALMALCAGNSPVTSEFPSHPPVTRAFDVYFRLNKRLSKQSWGWWFEAPSRSLWRRCNGRSKFIPIFQRNLQDQSIPGRWEFERTRNTKF